MTQPMENGHDAFARKISLSASENRDRNPNVKMVNPVDFFHSISLSNPPNIALTRL